MIICHRLQQPTHRPDVDGDPDLQWVQYTLHLTIQVSLKLMVLWMTQQFCSGWPGAGPKSASNGST